MLVTKLARVYAKALHNLALENKQEEEAKADMDQVAKVIAVSRDFAVLLKSPVVKADTKNKIVAEVFGNSLSELTLNFLKLVINHGREDSLSTIARAYTTIYLQHKGILEGAITSAQALDDKTLKAIEKEVVKQVGQKVQLDVKTDPDLIGGLILRVGDKQYNGSIAAELQRLRLDFNKNLYVPEF
jgi:F-type H+-transporting ATPase subunit delta